MSAEPTTTRRARTRRPAAHARAF